MWFLPFQEEYLFEIERDGVAVVTNPKGIKYHVNIWDRPRGVCTCYNYVKAGGNYRGRCKHLIWLLQSYICPDCGNRMLLESTGRYYECPNQGCRFSVGYDSRLVYHIRSINRKELRNVSN